MHSRLLAAASSMVASFVALGLAVADDPAATFGAPLVLGPARVELAIAGRVARTTVRYDVINPSAAPDEAVIAIDAPAGAVASGLRVAIGGRWLAGRLLDAEDASERYADFVEAAFVAARGPALLAGGGHSPLELHLLFVPARGRVTVEYQLEAPVCYARGRWLAALPGAASPRAGDGPPIAVVGGPRGAGRVVARATLEGELGASIDELCDDQSADGWDGPHLAVVDAALARGHRGELTTVSAGARGITELTVDVGVELAAAPVAPAVVFVVDASKSTGEAGVDAQLALIAAYLRSAPTARFDVVIYQRHAQRVFGALRPAADADRLLADVRARALPLRNGSNLDAGLALAADLLAAAPGPRRLIAFTDDRVREELDDVVASLALARLPPDAIAHLLAVSPADRSEYVRDFEHWLAPVAARWGGVAGRARVGLAPEPAAARVATFEELVRPRRIEAVVITHGAGDVDELGDLHEGTGVRTVGVDHDGRITVSGFIWGRRWEPTNVTAAAAQRRVAALAFGDPSLLDELEEPELRTLAFTGRVVSELTSLYAADPSWKPGGLPPEVTLGSHDLSSIRGISGHFSSSCSLPHTIGTAAGPARERPELVDLLAGPVARCALRHHRAAWDVTVELETTGREIVDVGAWAMPVAGGAAEADVAFAACVTEAAWELELDDRYASWTTTFTTRVTSGR